MIPKRILYSIAVGVATVFALAWWIDSIPARVTVINQSPVTLREVTLTAAGRTRDGGTLRSGEARTWSVRAGSEVELRFRGQRMVRWRSPRPVTAAQPLLIYVTPDEKIDVRSRIGTFTR
ncbi:MAG TPA: hypothetical protein VFL80_03205 [Thermoanaerobaculia bacterium]|nr:hypothetical protein [Thermoanaerobaculia bacterium]